MKANVQYADAPQASLGCHVNDASDEVTQQMYQHITSNATKSKTKKNQTENTYWIIDINTKQIQALP